MNEITRKAANALVATVDFFQGALAAEAQTGDAKQVQLDALAGQLRDQIKADKEACGLMQEEIDDLRKHRDELKEIVVSLEGQRNSLQKEVIDLRLLFEEFVLAARKHGLAHREESEYEHHEVAQALRKIRSA